MVSAIIVTYNRASFLSEAIESVINQTYFQRNPDDWELIIIDDGSTDRTPEIVRNYMADARIKYFRTGNRGVSAARNLGLASARGNFIGFLDSDDLWLKDKIQVQISYLKAFPKAMFCLTEEIWIRHGRRVNQARKHQKYSGWVLDKVLPLCLLSLSSALFRKELFLEIGNFDETLPVCEDYDLGLRIALRYPYHFISTPLILKRGGHADQLSRRYWGMDRWRIQALEKAFQENLNPEQAELIKAEIVKKCKVLIGGYEKRGKIEEANYYRTLIEKYRLSNE